MRTMRMVCTAALLVAAGAPGWAADSATVYNSGPLILGFLGLCALVVLAQFAPVAMILVGLARSVAELFTRKRAASRQEHRG